MDRFVRANIAICNRIEPSIVMETHAYEKYRERGEALLRLRPERVLDVGAGKRWHFDSSLKHPDMTLIGFDIDSEEMAPNHLLDEKYSGDACESLQVPDGSLNLIMGRAVVEHLHDTAAFLESAYRALGEDGRLIVTFASRHAPFALLNRLLPRRVSAWLLAHLLPGSKGILGFPAFYDRTTFKEFTSSLEAAGFEVEEAYASYFGSSYYRAFVPLYLLSLARDYVCHRVGTPRLACYFMFVARKGRL